MNSVEKMAATFFFALNFLQDTISIAPEDIEVVEKGVVSVFLRHLQCKYVSLRF